MERRRRSMGAVIAAEQAQHIAFDKGSLDAEVREEGERPCSDGSVR